jgi:hypothetical protein
MDRLGKGQRHRKGPWRCCGACGAGLFGRIDSVVCRIRPQWRLHVALSPERQLRRLSLDLRAGVPSVDEDEGVEGKEEMPEESIDAYVASDGFRLQARRLHEQLLWSNPSGVRISSAPMKIMNRPFEGTTLEIWAQCAGAPQVYRGGDGSHICQNSRSRKLATPWMERPCRAGGQRQGRSLASRGQGRSRSCLSSMTAVGPSPAGSVPNERGIARQREGHGAPVSEHQRARRLAERMKLGGRAVRNHLPVDKYSPGG